MKEKMRLADIVITNDGTGDELERLVKLMGAKMSSLSKKRGKKGPLRPAEREQLLEAIRA